MSPRYRSTDPGKPVAQITIHEGKYRQVKKMVAGIGGRVVEHVTTLPPSIDRPEAARGY